MTEPWHKIAFTEDLYLIPDQHKTPVSQSESTRIPSHDSVEPLSYEGKNLKNLVVLIPSPLAEDDRNFLGNILTAVDYNLDDIAIVVWDESRKEQIISELNPSKVICFGIPTDPWTHGPAYEVIVNESVKHFLADALPVISSDQNLKRKLWNGMKLLF